MQPECIFQIRPVATGLLVLFATGCDHAESSGSLVMTKTPALAASHEAADMLDARYPVGSRVVLRDAPLDTGHERILSGNLAAAGSPVISYDGQRVIFVGKASATNDWQIYQTPLVSWGPRALTSMPGGAMSPVLLPNGSIVFISPVTKSDHSYANKRPSALFVQPPGGQPRRLTFTSSAILDATILSDGRILYLAMQHSTSNSAPRYALFTINIDGTQVTAFAEQAVSTSPVQQLCQIPDSRVVFINSKTGHNSADGFAEFVRMARPSHGVSPLFSNLTARIRSVRPAGDDCLLICAGEPQSDTTPSAVFRLSSSAGTLGTPLAADPKWSFLEAVEVSARPPPMGRLSTVDLTKQTGKILCLDVNFTRNRPDNTRPNPMATRLRVTAEISSGVVRTIGEVPVQADGSFLAEVPADVPLGFEVMEKDGRVLRRQAPLIWVRPGENRSCVGCHEPPNRSPHNRRPLAVNVPVPRLSLDTITFAGAKSDP